MDPSPNYLRFFRKKTPLKQSDIAFLLDMPEYSSVSRYEKGKRAPPIDFLLTYHFLFNVPIEEFFLPDSKTQLPKLIEQINLLILRLKEKEPQEEYILRIQCLESTIKRLTTQA